MKRPFFLSKIKQQFRVHPVCALLGPRQAGKTTLARQFGAEYERQQVHYFDLEIAEDWGALQQPLHTLSQLRGLIVIDEIQRLPELFPTLRVLADRNEAHFLILGSASRDLIKQSSETLAGRIGYIELPPFSLFEEGTEQQSLLTRGGFPRSYLAELETDSFLWRSAYIQTFLERDIPQLGFSIPAITLKRFWMMLTYVHGQLLNRQALATSMGISSHNVSHYLDILAGTFMMRLLPPWFENIKKRQTKTPKLYFRDSGILLNLLGIKDHQALLHYPHLGAIWEGYALEQIIQAYHAAPEEIFFWRTQQGAELDLLVFKDQQRIGFEFKFTEKPSVSKSMHIAIEDLKLDQLLLIYPGQRDIQLTSRITAKGLTNVVRNLQHEK